MPRKAKKASAAAASDEGAWSSYTNRSCCGICQIPRRFYGSTSFNSAVCDGCGEEMEPGTKVSSVLDVSLKIDAAPSVMR